MKKILIIIGLFIVCFCSCYNRNTKQIIKGGVIYDFTLADLSIKYIETGDSFILTDIVETEGLKLLYNHANWARNNTEKLSPYDFAKKIISINNKKKDINAIIRNTQYVKDSISANNYPQEICLKYLPAGFTFSTSLYYTVGYDLGIVFMNNSSVNLSHKHYLENYSELKYYSIHELHHAGFVSLKKNYMPSLNINTFNEMAKLIDYFTHLEGMAVYAAYEERKKNNAIDKDADYIALSDSVLMKKYVNRYFEIYNYFLENPNDTLKEKDWLLIGELSSDNRLWYRVGSTIAETIDKKLGRTQLNALICEPSEKFINTYLLIKDK